MRRTVMACASLCCALALGLLLGLGLAGCSGSRSDIAETGPEDSTDQMWRESVVDEVLYVFPYEGRVITTQNPEVVDVVSVETPMTDGETPMAESMEDGKFYKIVADVTYLNGGVAGYVDYPQIERVTSYEEVSPFQIGLSSIEEGPYGLSLIGDYADGDLFFYEMGIMAVWKDGAWVWSYDDAMHFDDGVTACCCSGVSDEEIREGVAAGVLSCEDYFVLPSSAVASPGSSV